MADRLLNRVDANAQPGLITRGSVLVERPFLDGLIKRGYRLAVRLFSGCLVALFNGLAQDAQLGTQTRRVGAIGGGSLRSLARTLQRRKMICHSWFVTFVSAERYSG
jgi:hypothetical protein